MHTQNQSQFMFYFCCINYIQKHAANQIVILFYGCRFWKLYVQWLRWLKIHLTLNLCQNSKCKQLGFYLVLLSGNPSFFINCKVIQHKHIGKSYICVCSCYKYLLQLKSTSFPDSSFLYMLWFLQQRKGVKPEGKERWVAFTRQNFTSAIKISFGFRQLIFSGIMFHPKTCYLELPWTWQFCSIAEV